MIIFVGEINGLWSKITKSSILYLVCLMNVQWNLQIMHLSLHKMHPKPFVAQFAGANAEAMQVELLPFFININNCVVTCYKTCPRFTNLHKFYTFIEKIISMSFQLLPLKQSSVLVINNKIKVVWGLLQHTFWILHNVALTSESGVCCRLYILGLLTELGPSSVKIQINIYSNKNPFQFDYSLVISLNVSAF